MKLKAVPEINDNSSCEGCIFDPNCYDTNKAQIIDGVNYHCGRNCIIYVEDKEIIEVKQLTIEELRDQFEKTHSFLNLNRNSNNNYIDSTANLRWDSYICCAEQNGILKE